MGDFYGAKYFYMESLSKTNFTNNRIHKETLQRLWSINKRIGVTYESPEKILLSRYYIKKKSVQMLLDQSSFSNTKTLKSSMYLAKMLFESLENQDSFGLRVLRNGYNPRMSVSDCQNEKLTQPVS